MMSSTPDGTSVGGGDVSVSLNTSSNHKNLSLSVSSGPPQSQFSAPAGSLPSSFCITPPRRPHHHPFASTIPPPPPSTTAAATTTNKHKITASSNSRRDIHCEDDSFMWFNDSHPLLDVPVSVSRLSCLIFYFHILFFSSFF